MPSNSSGTIHHSVASTRKPDHHPPKTNQRLFGRCVSIQITATRTAAAVATALTAPIKATASADCAAARRTVCFASSPARYRTIGIRTHGASIIGIVSEEIDARVVITRGESTKAVAAIRRELRLPIPRASASRTIPQNPAMSSKAHQMR